MQNSEDFDYTKGDPNFMSGQDFAEEYRSGKGCLIWTIVLIIAVIWFVISIFI